MTTRQKKQAPLSARKRGFNSLLRVVMVFVYLFSITHSAFATIDNTANAGGFYNAAPVTSSDSIVNIPVGLSAQGITLLKSSVFNDENADTFAQVGETISYSFSVQNSGNVTLTNVTITDPVVNVSGGPIASLPPGVTDTGAFTATYTLLAADITAGSVINSATANGTPPTGPDVTDVSDSQNPGDDTGANNDPTKTTLTKAPIDAVNDTATGVDGFTGNPSVFNIYTNDTLAGNGVVPANVNLTISGINPVPPELTLNLSTGVVGVPAGTPAGIYDFEYTICEVANPTNCDTAIASVTVVASPIIANDDDFSAVPISVAGGTTATVFTNDTLNGIAFAPAAVIPSLVSNGGLTGLTINANGTLTVPANTTPGTYTANYTICETAQPANCDPANAIIVVDPPIDAVNDNFSATPISVAGGTTPTVFTNDTLNGVAFLPAAVTPTLVSNGGLTGLVLNADGTLTVPASTTPGTYTASYQICEVAVPTNCDTANAIITVNPPINAVNDNFSAAPISVVGGTTATVFTNDTLNGAPFLPAAVTPTLLSDGGLTGLVLNTNGTLTVPASTTPGTYIANYRICEVAVPTNCDTANAIIVVNPPIDAVNDDFSATSIGQSGGNTATVYSNDTLNGVAFLPAAVTPTLVANGGLTGLTINPDGTLSVPAATTAGTYTATYQICEVAVPTNCDTAAAIIVVNALIDAVNDDFTAAPISVAGGNTATVFTNDTLNGSPFLPAAVTLTLVSNGGLAGLVLNSDGTLTVPPSTAAGIYTANYKICEVALPANCDTANAIIKVNPPIDAVNDDFSAAPISVAGGNTATVFTNDTLNGAPFLPAAVTPTLVSNGGIAGLVLNPNGTLTVPASTPSGTYTANYQICEVAVPTNCDTATVIIKVNPPIDAVNDNFTSTPISAVGGTTQTVFTNDTLNGVPFLPVAVTPTLLSNGGIVGLVLNANGTLTVPAATASGTYIANYRICEVAVPSNCDTANAIIVVNPPIDAVNDDFTTTPISAVGGSTATVFTNDTLNGAPFLPVAVTTTLVSNGTLAGLAINSNGILTVPANTTPGVYTANYRICEVAVPTNCDTADVIIRVNPPIDAVNDDFSAAPISLLGGNTTTVFTNDTLNGAPFLPAAVTPTLVSNGGIAGLVLNPDGTLTVPPSTPGGTYVANYKICELAVPTNCDTANVIVKVNPPIDAVNDDFTASPISVLGGTTTTVFGNDTLNGNPFIPTAVTPTLVTNGGVTGLVLNANGTLTVPASTPAGTYPANYRICEIAIPTNCDTANVIIKVNPPIDAVNDDFSAAPISVAGGNTATVFTNDTLNGAPFVPAAVTPTLLSNGGIVGLVLNANGTLTVPAATASGTYIANYRICEVAVPSNCDTANAIIVVNPPIDAVNDDFTPTPVSAAGGTTATVYGNDTLNGVLFAPAAVTRTLLADGGIPGLVLNPNGTVTVPPNAPPGPHTASYRICEVAVPTNCDTATVIIVVTPPVIDAVNDDFSATPFNGTIANTTPSIFSNDTLNALGFPASAVIPSIVSNGGITGLTIDPATGTLGIPAGTANGTYTVTYQICQASFPTNCDTATVNLVINDNATVTGTVFFDKNGDTIYNGGDVPSGAGYIVELRNSSNVLVGTTTTDTAGAYSITAPPGPGYTLVFKTPTGITLGTLTNLTLPPGTTVNNQNQPIDPSGIIYNSVTRLPVAGVTVTINDSAGNPLPAACLIDPSQQNQVTGVDGAYRFDLVPGGAAACPLTETQYGLTLTNPPGYVANPPTGVSTLLPPQAGPLQATGCPVDAVPPGGACQISASANPPASPAGATYYMTFLLENGDPHVVNNHIPIDPIISTTSGFTKKALVVEARRGERVPYVIEANAVTFNPVRIVDVMPPGFDFVAGSATSNGVAVVPTVSGRSVTFNGLVPSALGKIKLELVLIATIAVATGPQVNNATLVNPLTGEVVATAKATVTIVAEHVFDCGDIIGRVFDDKNRNGYPDQGEPGLAGVRIVTVKGVQITTDKKGLFHVACADIPDSDIGSNFVLKLDTRTLPTGYRVTTENPAVVRLTRGKVVKMNFGASITRLVKFDMTNDAFVSGAVELKPQWLTSIDELIAVLAQDKSTLRLTYFAKTKGSQLASDRAAAVEKLITDKWAAQSAPYKLPIETRVIGSK